MSTVNGFQVGSETLKYNYESLDNYNTPNFSTSSSKTYTVGDYVMYNGKLYKCTTATTGGTWVSGNWTEAVLSDDVDDLSRQLNDSTTGLDTKAPVILETVSGAIASFDDGADGMPVKKLVASIEPVQDLHGYENPWPAGGGKNLVNNKLTNTTTNGVTFTINDDGTFTTSGTASSDIQLNIDNAISLTNGVTYYLTGCPSGGGASSYQLNIGGGTPDYGNGSQITMTEDLPVTQVRIKIMSGTNMNGLLFKPMLRTSGDATFEPYENICPISGYTGAEIEQTGVNLFDGELESGDINIVNGAKRANANRFRSVNYISVKPNTTYYSRTPYDNFNICCYDVDKNWVSSEAGIGYFAGNNRSFTTPSWCHYILFYANGAIPASGISINYPATDTEYHPYTGDQISVTFPDEAGTVYGGTLTINPDRTGTLVADRAMVDLGEVNWGYYTSSANPLFRAVPLVTDGETYNIDTLPDILSSSYIVQATKTQSTLASAMPDKHCTFVANSLNFCIRDDSYTDVATFKAAVSGQKIVYKLATPQTIQLTATEVSGILTSLYGQNNVWTDVGEVSVDYPADTKLYIDNKITTAIANAMNS